MEQHDRNKKKFLNYFKKLQEKSKKKGGPKINMILF